MPIPLIIGAVAAAAGIYGAAKGVSGAMDHSSAKDLNSDAQNMVNTANLKVEDQRKKNQYHSGRLRAAQTASVQRRGGGIYREL